MNMFNFLRKKHGMGFLLDKRPESEKILDYKAEEVFIFKAINWIEKPQNQWKTYPMFDQKQTSSCVSQTLAKVLGVENVLEENRFIDFSKRDIYSQGYEPDGGMYYAKALDLVKKNGITIESLMPSQNLTEIDMRMRRDSSIFSEQVALVGKPKNYLYININFDDIANILDSGKAICLGVRFNAGGFNSAEVKLNPNGQYGHAITVVEYALWKGQKALIFDNSWSSSWGINGQGIITEDQKSGIVAAAYFENLENNWRDIVAPIKPKFTFTKDLSFGMRNNDIIQLQDCLAFENLFTVLSTGYFGIITKKAVISFQIKHKITPAEGYCGPITREKLNILYG